MLIDKNTLYLPTTGAILVNLPGPPEVEAEADRRVEYSKRCPQVPDDDPATLARMKRLLAKPRIRTSTYSDDGD